MTQLLGPIIRAGYHAARVAQGPSANPWCADTVGALAWAFGHNLGSLPAAWRWPILGGAWAIGVVRDVADGFAAFVRAIGGW